MLKLRQVIGIVSLTIGVICMIYSFSNMSGFLFLEDAFPKDISILGVALVIGGLLLMSSTIDEIFLSHNASKYEKLKKRYSAPDKLANGGLDLMDYLWRKDILFERTYLSAFPRKREESKEDFQARLGEALSNQQDYPAITQKVDTLVNKIRAYSERSQSTNFLRELRRHADDEIRDAYMHKFLDTRERERLLMKGSAATKDKLFNTKEFRRFKEKSLMKIEEYNDHVKSGKWVLIDIYGLNPSFDRKFSDDSYSQILYFGPAELLGEIKSRLEKSENPSGIRKFLDKKAEMGEVGKAHMIAEGDVYSHLHWEIKNLSRKYL